MRKLLLFSALAFLGATQAAADTRETSFQVRPGRPWQLTAVNESRGDANSLTWAIVTVDGYIVAMDLQPGLRAQTVTVVRAPGLHRAVLVCNNQHASVAACTLTAGPISQARPGG